jgi:hypothetical protein
MERRLEKRKKTRYFFFPVLSDSAFERTSDLRVGGSNPSGPASKNSSLQLSSLTLSQFVPTSCARRVQNQAEIRLDKPKIKNG